MRDILILVTILHELRDSARERIHIVCFSVHGARRMGNRIQLSISIIDAKLSTVKDPVHIIFADMRVLFRNRHSLALQVEHKLDRPDHLPDV